MHPTDSPTDASKLTSPYACPCVQFSFLPAPFEVYPAIGADQGVQLAQQGMQLGGSSYVDFVLVAPDFLHNRR